MRKFLLTTLLLALVPGIAQASTLVGVGNVPGCNRGTGNPIPHMRTYRANVYRVIIQHQNYGAPDHCIALARAAHVKVELVIQYRNTWSLTQDRAWFTRVLDHYGSAPYIAVGNEQELALHRGRGQSGQQYSKVWRAVKSIGRHYAPRARLIAGEGTGSLTSYRFLADAVRAGLPGAQVLAAHPYCRPLQDFLALGHRTRLPVWLDEGLAGPHAWPNSHCTFTRDQARGAQMAAVWMAR